MGTPALTVRQARRVSKSLFMGEPGHAHRGLWQVILVMDGCIHVLTATGPDRPSVPVGQRACAGACLRFCAQGREASWNALTGGES